MPFRKSLSSAKLVKKPKATQTNEKGEVTSWDSMNEDGKLLKLLSEEGLLSNKTASTVKQDYPQFGKYALHTLNSALSNARVP